MSLLLALLSGSPSGYTLGCAEGSYALDGVSATVKRSKTIAVAVGSYAVTGKAATLTYTPVAGAYSITANAGAYAIAGQSATIAFSGLSTQAFTAEVELTPRRKWYVKRKKQILIFSSAQEADAFIEADELAEQAIAQAQKTSRRARKRLRERVYSANPVQPIESVDIDQLGALVDRYQMAIDLPALIVQQDYERVMQIMALAMQMQDEDDIEMLLIC